MRTQSTLDQLLCAFDVALQTIFIPKQRQSKRPNPAEGLTEPKLSAKQRRHTAGLMRVNHAGEVCAQALYQGQALTARQNNIKEQMTQAANEEVDHLAWCEQRLNELNASPSRLNPLWYLGSFVLGAGAGLLGDRWSLGFVAETENQVGTHLQNHLDKISTDDHKTAAILKQMHTDEVQHETLAKQAGAAPLPPVVQHGMRCVSRLLTWGSYRV